MRLCPLNRIGLTPAKKIARQKRGLKILIMVPVVSAIALATLIRFPCRSSAPPPIWIAALQSRS